jgi:hypothetical protein
MPSRGSPYGRALGGRNELGRREWAKLVDRLVDPDTHNLHAGVGERCMICDLRITRGQPVRRTVSGGYVHDVC